ncbi:substrate-binding domain-containing protein [Jannaschia sp. R86511]|uniref:substrate-binding domain-containing protein n=1 Tax=Jannaschia sp. R86511 TaxID=3093853 RepID=UPI0036D29897
MTDPLRPALSRLGRRGFLIGGAAAGAAGLAACTGAAPSDEAAASAPAAAAGGGASAEPGTPVTLGFSAPAADHGWIAAITENARAQAEQHPDVTLQLTEGTNEVNLQISQVQSLLDAGIDALVILPFDGNALTEIAREVMDAGVPVINLDRRFSSPLAYRTFIAGDNYGMGVAAGNYIGQRLTDEGVSSPVIGEIAGIDALELTQQRSQGFADALSSFGFEVGPRQAAEFTVESGDAVTRQLLQATGAFDAIWNHDDDQGIGVLAAIADSGRDEFFMVGGAGSLNAMQEIQSGESVLQATVTYSPSMASSAINLARLVAQGRGMTDLVENEVPEEIILSSATITSENVDQYLELGFES